MARGGLRCTWARVRYTGKVPYSRVAPARRPNTSECSDSIVAACQHHSVDPSSWQCLALTIYFNIPLVLRIKPHFRIRTRVRCPGSPEPWSRSTYTHQAAAPDSLAFEYTTPLGLEMCLPRRKLSAHELHDDALSPSAVKSHAFVSPTIPSDPLDSG